MAVLKVVASDGVAVEQGEETDAEILSNAMVALSRSASCGCLPAHVQSALRATASMLALFVPGERGRD